MYLQYIRPTPLIYHLWWYRTPAFFITMQGVTPLLTGTSCAAPQEILQHPSNSTDMSPCDYDLFSKVKEPLQGTRYNTGDELKASPQ